MSKRSDWKQWDKNRPTRKFLKPKAQKKPVVMFMGKPGHVRCIQRHANRDIMGQTLR